MELSEWIRVVSSKRKELLGETQYNILEKLKDSELTLTDDTAPLLEIEPSLSEGGFGVSEGAPVGTLLDAAKTIFTQMGEVASFGSPTAFKSKITLLKNDPAQGYVRFLSFMTKVEKLLNVENQQAIDLMDEKNYPLYIWYAVANFDRVNAGDLFPFLGEAEADTPETVETESL
jgi:hypothetical protein